MLQEAAPGTVSPNHHGLTGRRNEVRGRRALNLNRKAISLAVVAFIYFHFMGDRNLFPPPAFAAAPAALITLAPGEHLHDLLTGRLNRGESPSPSSDSFASQSAASARQTTVDPALSEAARHDKGKS